MNTDVHMRWMIHRDWPGVLDVEQSSFANPWNEDDLCRAMRLKNCIGMIAEAEDDTVAGFMVYELHKTKLHITNFAVAPSRRRQGVGTCMVRKLQLKLSYQRRTRLTLHIRESNLQAQLFFRSHGFKAVNVLRNLYEDTDEDAYVFQYRYTKEGNIECSCSADGKTNACG